MIVVYLSETGRHFSAAGSGSRDEYQILGQWDVIVMTESVFAEDHIDILRISVNLVSFSYPILFPLKIFFEFEDDIEHITDIDVVDDDMRFDSDILFYVPDHLIDVVLVSYILVAQLPVG
jgi:hypothetical protein